MPREFTLSRRTALAALGTVGVASAGAGVGTSAFFSDGESFENDRLVAGTLDMKAAYSVHYLDWSADELDGIDDDAVTTTGPMTEFDPGPRSLPGIEFATEGDRQQFLANTLVHADGDASCPDGTDADDLQRPVVELDDLKPGDHGEVTFDLALCDNPGYVWLGVADATAAENGYTEPERDDPDESGLETLPGEPPTDHHVELLDAVRAAYWIDDGDDYVDGDEAFQSRGSLRDVLGDLSGIGVALEGDVSSERGGGTGGQGCFSPGRHSVGFVWWLPVDHANETQSDSVRFSLTFYTEQCRHNDGTGDRLSAFVNDDAPLNERPWDGAVADRTGHPEVVVTNNALTQVTFPDVPPFGPPPQTLPLGFDPQVVRVSPGTTVTWHWATYADPFPDFFDEIPHNVVAPDGSFSSGPPEPATTASDFSHTFTEPGLHPYVCVPHGSTQFHHSSPGVPFQEVINESGMRGAILVED
ncbi:cupredoxin domain-containing protein [Haloplanus salinus]|nr:plastocyanin/azurin family copper-binding protein [Haloplanus salinus]